MEFQVTSNRVFLNNEAGELIAEVTFPLISEDTVNMDHTFVDDSLRGQGIAGKLVSLAVEQIRKDQKKVIPTCSYAKGWFEKHPEHHDILKNK